MPWQEIVGVMHVHTTYSDGSKSPQKVIQIAKSLGLDFLFFTDHNTLEPLATLKSAFSDDLYVNYGVELSAPREHLLSFNLTTLPKKLNDARSFSLEATQQGAITFVAHPMDTGSNPLHLPAYAWQSWNSPFTGIEVWNSLSSWVGLIHKKRDILRILSDPYRDLPEPTTSLQKWDELNKTRKVVAVVGVDAHEPIRRLFGFPLTLLTYRQSFQTLRNHIWVQEWQKETAEAMILKSLRDGRLYMANHRMGNPYGFFAQWEKTGDLPGAQIPWVSGTLIGEAPQPITWELWRDGACILSSHGRTAHLVIEKPGIYRLMGRRHGKLWLLTNPWYFV